MQKDICQIMNIKTFSKCKLVELIVLLFVLSQRYRSIYLFSNIKELSTITSVFELMLCFILIANFVKNQGKIRKQTILFLAALSVVLLICFCMNKSKMLIVALLIYLNGRREKFENIIRAIGIGNAIILFVAVILYFLGISDAGTARNYDVNRMAISLGFNHPNAASETIIFCIMAWICEKKRRIVDILSLFLVSELFIFFIFKSRTAVMLLFLFVLLVLIEYKNYKKRNGKIPKKRLFFVIALLLPIVLAVFSYSMVKLMEYPTIQMINENFAKRFYLAALQLETYGLSLFGRNVESYYLGLDNSYVSYAIEYGIIPIVIFGLAHFGVVIKAWNRNNIILVICAVIFSLYAFMENGFINIFTNFTYMYILVGEYRGASRSDT